MAFALKAAVSDSVGFLLNKAFGPVIWKTGTQNQSNVHSPFSEKLGLPAGPCALWIWGPGRSQSFAAAPSGSEGASVAMRNLADFGFQAAGPWQVELRSENHQNICGYLSHLRMTLRMPAPSLRSRAATGSPGRRVVRAAGGLSGKGPDCNPVFRAVSGWPDTCSLEGFCPGP
jgi:hypothetical protein